MLLDVRDVVAANVQMQPQAPQPQTLLYSSKAKGWYDRHGQRHDEHNAGAAAAAAVVA